MYNKHYSTKKTDQSQPIAGRENDMKKNNAGGFTFTLDKWGQLQRFLILGSEDGSYYQDERSLTVDNAKNVMACIKEDGVRVVKELLEINLAGRAMKVNSQIFALALVASHGDEVSRKFALENLNKVARTGTHLFTFLEYVQAHRGWGRALRRAVANWYLDKDTEKLAYQVVKYRQRGGWTHRDALRLSHPKTDDKAKDDVLKFAAYNGTDTALVLNGELPEIIKGYQLAQELSTAPATVGVNKQMADLVLKYKLPREAIPSQFLNQPEVQKALLQDMPITATIRNLGGMSASGVLTPLSEEETLVIDRITSEENLQKGRVHPISVLFALKTYSQGCGIKGNLSWSVNNRITSALETAYEKAFKYVEPSGKRYYVAVDVSGSMGWSPNGVLKASEAAAAIAQYIARTEPSTYVAGFSTGMKEMNVTKTSSLKQVMDEANRMTMGSTDCAAPMLDALKKGINVDVFVVITDNETWFGRIHPSQALEEYRRKVNPEAKLMVLATEPTKFSIADPNDSGMMDIAGFDSNFPAILKEFATGFTS